MPNWSLRQLLASLHRDIEQRLDTIRQSLAHAPTMGDASEKVWLDLLNTYLPRRYEALSAHVVDSQGVFSQQIDVVVFDRQYTPRIFQYEGKVVLPAEGVYAVFEAKQTMNAKLIGYAQEKAATVRALQRTSGTVQTVAGPVGPKPPAPILGGILALESDWSPPLGEPLRAALLGGDVLGRLDLGCVAAHGMLALRSDGDYALTLESKPATAFLFELIARLQEMGTAPRIDMRAYAQWLLEPSEEDE